MSAGLSMLLTAENKTCSTCPKGWQTLLNRHTCTVAGAPFTSSRTLTSQKQCQAALPRLGLNQGPNSTLPVQNMVFQKCETPYFKSELGNCCVVSLGTSGIVFFPSKSEALQSAALPQRFKQMHPQVCQGSVAFRALPTKNPPYSSACLLLPHCSSARSWAAHQWERDDTSA